MVRSDFDLTNQCLVTLHHLIGSAQWETEGELTILRLGIRIFNSAAAGLKCARSGYYQPAFAQVRDILEVSYLLDLFRQNPEMVGQWLSTKASYKLFSPRAVRKALSKAEFGICPARRDLFNVLRLRHASNSAGLCHHLAGRDAHADRPVPGYHPDICVPPRSCSLLAICDLELWRARERT